MVDDEFEWDDRKAAANFFKHGVRFDAAREVFNDAFAIDRLDDRDEFGEPRFVTIGMVDGRLLLVAYTMRGDTIRIISARGADPVSNDNITKTKDKPTKHDWARFDAMTPEQRTAAAISDPDAQPLGPDDFQRMKRTPQVKVIRRALSLTQEQFAERFHIPLGTLRDWEQGAAQPDQSARAYLTVIARDPEAVRKALDTPRR